MELTQRERLEVLATCRTKASEGRDRASRISSPDLRDYAEHTARMWEEMAATFAEPASQATAKSAVGGTGTLDEILASAGEQ